jgi:CO/xanthine dehydrogenase Mo-binding subunit
LKVRVFYHDKCFDGACSAALFSRFYRERIGNDVTFVFSGLLHRAGSLFDEKQFDGDENAIVDFKYSSSPRITWWFDHHQSAFLTPEDAAHFEQDQSNRKFYDPDFKSCTSFIATVVEAEVDGQGGVRLRRITSAVDTGIGVNPDTIAAQLQGGLIFGLTAALYGEITIDKGRVQQSNFNDYRMLRIDEVPEIDVHVIKSGEAPGGIGETGATAGPPALRNAIYAATGVALRRLPIDRDLLAVRKRS